MSRYCLDANVFIEAKNGPYAFDIFPRFWEWLDEMSYVDSVSSCQMVLTELSEGNDDLAQWARARRDTGFFAVPDARVQEAVSTIAAHVTGSFEPHQAETFLGGADPW